MAKYRKIDPRIWNDLKFRQLSDNGKLVFFMLLTHPHMTAVGAMRATIQGLAAEIGWSEKAFREAFGEGLKKGMVKVDFEASFLWIPNFIKYNQPESPNVVTAWVKALEDLPECPLFYQLIQYVKDYLKDYSEGFRKPFKIPFAQPSPNQEQEQEQEQEQDKREKEKVDQKEKFQKPTLHEIKTYITEKGSHVDAEQFFNFYEAKGWKIGKNPMVSWKHAIATWEKRKNADTQKPSKFEISEGARSFLNAKTA